MLLPHWTPRQVTDFRKQGWGAAGAQGRRPAARAQFRGPAQLRRRSEEPGLQPSPRAVARLGTGAKGPGRRRPPAWVGAGALPTGTHTTPERKQQFTGREGRDLHKTSANRGRGEKAMAPRTTRPLQRRTPAATAVERQSGRRLRQEHGPPHRQSLARRAARDGHRGVVGEERSPAAAGTRGPRMEGALNLHRRWEVTRRQDWKGARGDTD